MPIPFHFLILLVSLTLAENILELPQSRDLREEIDGKEYELSIYDRNLEDHKSE